MTLNVASDCSLQVIPQEDLKLMLLFRVEQRKEYIDARDNSHVKCIDLVISLSQAIDLKERLNAAMKQL